jgi:hypothetical protein
MPINDGQKEWAWREAARRSLALDGPYKVYRIQIAGIAGTDHILRTAEAAPPDPNRWKHVATFLKGEQIFGEP